MDDNADEMFCPSCGERINRTDTFCRFCGAQNTKGEGRSWGPTRGFPPGETDLSGGDRRSSSDSEHTTARDGWNEGGSETRRWRDGSSQTRRGPRQAYGQSEREQGADSDANRWRRHFPNQNPDKSNLRVVAGAIGLGLLGFILLQLFSIVGLLPAFLTGASAETVLESTEAILFGTAVGQILGFVGFSLWYLRRRGLDWDGIKSYLGVRRPTLREGGIILGAPFVIFLGAIVVGLIATALGELLGISDPDEPVGAEQDITDALASNPELIPFAILMMFLIVGPAEEIMFRGVVQARMRERISAVPAIILTAIGFALIHVPGFALGASLLDILTGVAVLTIGGIVFGYVYEKTENIVVVSILHGFYNSIVLVLVYIVAVYDLDEMMVSVLSSVPL